MNPEGDGGRGNPLRAIAREDGTREGREGVLDCAPGQSTSAEYVPAASTKNSPRELLRCVTKRRAAVPSAHDFKVIGVDLNAKAPFEDVMHVLVLFLERRGAVAVSLKV